MRFCFLLVILLGNGCGQRRDVVMDSLSFEDDLGRQVDVKLGTINRIVSLSPALTESLFALGYGDRIVGVSKSCNYPIEAKEKKSVGGPDEKRLSFETIIALKPDLVFADGGYQKGAIESLAKLGVKVYACETNSILGVCRSMETLSRVLGETEASRRVIDQFSAMERQLTINRYPNPPSVFYFVGDPLWTSGGNSFTNELIERAGGKNLFGDLKQKYLSINEEELVKRNPDVIVLVRPANPEAKRAELLAKPTWRTLNAIKNNRIVFLDEDSSSRPGPRILDAIRELELALHPKPKP